MKNWESKKIKMFNDSSGSPSFDRKPFDRQTQWLFDTMVSWYNNRKGWQVNKSLFQTLSIKCLSDKWISARRRWATQVPGKSWRNSELSFKKDQCPKNKWLTFLIGAVTFSIMTLSIMALGIMTLCIMTIFSIMIQGVTMLSIAMLNVVLISVSM